MRTTLLVLLFVFLSALNFLSAQTRYEAEDGLVTGATFSDSIPGFSGSGYIVFEATGSVTVTVNVETAGSYPLSIGYRSVFGEKIQDLYINGELAQQISFPQSDDFKGLDIKLFDLNVGNNTIEVRKSYGYMDLDYFSIGEKVGSSKYEAEDGKVTDAAISSEGTGFSGTGYVVFEDAGTAAITVEAGAAGTFPLTVGYRSVFGEKIQDLYVNDSLIQNVSFPGSTEFTSLTIGSIPLKTGTNTIEIRKNYGYMDLDYFEIGAFKVPGALEAEEGTVTDANVSSAVLGFSGAGYVVFEATGSVAVTVEKVNSGSYPLTFGYRSIFDDKPQDLYINGIFIENVNFVQSDEFTTLNYGLVQLNAGSNTIEIRKSYGYMDLDYFLVGDESSPVPVADAGFQQIKMDVDGNGTETFTLDASGSTDANDDIVSYAWFLENGDKIGEGPQLEFEAAIGGLELTLEVTDAEGNAGRDTVQLFVGDPTNGGNNRVGVVNNSQFIFSDGINLAWDRFASDVTNLDAAYFEGVLDSIQASGGNSMRWWLHTNGANSPQFDAAGNVTGLDPNAIPNMRTVLDLAYNRGVAISMCLWSFDMLRDQGQNVAAQKALLEDPAKTQTYIDNALTPILEEIGAHPAILTWEIFNEPENMTEEFGFTEVRTPMAAVQQFINLTAGAIHSTVPGAMVSSGAGNFATMTDIEGHTNYYRDDRLIAAGGDALGTLDFYQVHYYPENFGLDLSPFHRPADWWQLDKPIVLAEFPSSAIEEDEAQSYTMQEAYRLAYEYGYAGALAWDYRGYDGGSFETAKAGIAYLAETYPEDIDLIVDPDLINNPPRTIATVPDLNLLLGTLERVDAYVSLDTLFMDKEDGTALEYSIAANSNEALVAADITEDNKLNLVFAPGEVGKSVITLRARDMDGASASLSFRVNIREDNGNLALFKPIVASTIEDEDLNETYANDGDQDSRWSSMYENNQWVYVDLEKPTAINTVKLFWETASGKGYELQVSDDAVTWQTLFTEETGDGGEDVISFDQVTTQYVRMYGSTRNTEFGFSLYEFEIYGDGALSLTDRDVEGISVYPNPLINNDLKLQVRDQGPVTVELIDLLGRRIAHYQFEGNTEYPINAAQVKTGLILVKITGENWGTTFKILKK